MWEKSRKGREESKAMRQREIEKREAINDLGEGWKGREESRLREQKEKVK